MEKSTFSFKVNNKRYSTKITEERNPQALLNYISIEEDNLNALVKEWLRKVEEQRRNIKSYQEQMDK